MKAKILLIVMMVAIIATGCHIGGVRGNGRLKTEVREVEEFNKIEAGGSFSISIIVGKEASIRIKAEENLIPLIRTKIKGNTLVIDSKKNLNPRKEIRIEITTPNLEYLDASGANDIKVEGLSEGDFKLDLSGASNIELFGEIEKFIAELSGAGNIDAKSLIAKDVRVDVSGAASAEVYAKESLDASVSGVGSITYFGNPEKTRTNVSGVGSISRR